MSTPQTILITVLSLCTAILIAWLIRISIATKRVNRNPKKGMYIKFYIGADKYRGIINRVFKKTVHVRDMFNKIHIVKKGELYI